MAITIEEVVQMTLNLVQEREQAKLLAKQLDSKVKELEVELKAVRLPDKTKE